MTDDQQRQVAQRIDPTMKEYFDVYLVVAVPVDDPTTGVYIASGTGSRIDQEQLEDHMIALAAQIVRRRKAVRRGG